ncbi:hypothetical protein, partial [Escherichia coli]|uniref:hypothetical protein n=1 Tax=Escherichia coli TaxID=562 RepID=UPI001BC862A1
MFRDHADSVGKEKTRLSGLLSHCPTVGHFFARIRAALMGYHGATFFLFSFLPDVGQFSGKFSGKKK